MKKLVLILALCLMPIAARAQSVFNCSSGFSTSGACGVGFQATGQAFWTSSSSGLSGSNVIFIPTGATHNGTGMFYQTPVDVQAFTTTFSFVPNGQNFSFVINNATTQGGPKYLSSGAGCEAGFYQAFGTPPVNNVFALELDSYSNLTASSSSFTYSSAQIYQMNQSPCLPNDGGSNYYATPKISTSPVPFNSPVNTQNTTTGHVYSATVTYDGTTVSLSLYDITAGGSCPGASCFTHSWANVNIPSLVGSNTAYVGFTGGIGLTTSYPLYVDSFAYTVDTAPSAPSYSTYTSSLGATVAANPTFSPAAGSYSGTQNVTIASTTTGAYYCYILSATTPSLMPQTDNNGSCLVGTKYTAPLSVSSSQTLYAMAGTNNGSVVLGLPSSLVVGSYTIGTPTAAQPVFSPVSGTYAGAQSVTLTNPSSAPLVCYGSSSSITIGGASVCPSGTTQYSGAFTVASSGSYYAKAGGTGFLDSILASVSYTITLPTASTPTFSPAAGTYTSAQSVAISNPSGAPLLCWNSTGAAIVINGSGTCPSGSSVYAGSISVSSTETLYAVAGGVGYNDSSTSSAAYIVNAPLVTPIINPGSGVYSTPRSVTLINVPSGAVACYAVNAVPTAPTQGICGSGSSTYSGAFSVASSGTVEVLYTQIGHTNSAVSTATYVIGPTLTFSGSLTGAAKTQ